MVARVCAYRSGGVGRHCPVTRWCNLKPGAGRVNHRRRTPASPGVNNGTSTSYIIHYAIGIYDINLSRTPVPFWPWRFARNCRWRPRRIFLRSAFYCPEEMLVPFTSRMCYFCIFHPPSTHPPIRLVFFFSLFNRTVSILLTSMIGALFGTIWRVRSLQITGYCAGYSKAAGVTIELFNHRPIVRSPPPTLEHTHTHRYLSYAFQSSLVDTYSWIKL